LAGDREAALDLIYQEFYLRREAGESPAPQEYLERFPGLATALIRQFAVDAAVQTVDGAAHASLDTATEADRQLGEATQASPAPAQRVAIDGYEIMRELGRGGMGVVYLARNVALGRSCALKMVLAAGHASREALDRFLTEARSFAELDHPNVLKIFHVGRHEGLLFLELEYAEGGSLDGQLDGTPWHPRRAALLVEPLARAVAEAHDRGIIHRDLKPANVLLGAAGIPKIGDFKLAKLLNAESRFTQTDSVLGSPSYMAPEQAQGLSRQVGPSADIYSLGAILYELLTGRPPFKAQTVLETLEQVKTREPVRPTVLVQATPRDMETIALKCLEKEPHKRYPSALALADDLKRFQEGRPILARPVSLPGRTWRWCRRNHKLAALSGLLAATAVLAVLAIVGLAYRHNIQLRAEVRRTEAKAEEARRNYQEAGSTIGAMLDLLSDSRFEGIPRMTDLLRAEREAALAFYERIFSKVDPASASDSVVLVDTITARMMAAKLEYTLGNTERAQGHIERALDLTGRAHNDHHDSVRLRAVEIECWMNLGIYFLALHQRDQAIAAARRSVELAEGFVAAGHDRPSDQELLALCYNGYATNLDYAQRNSEALRFFQKSISIRQRIDPSQLPGVTARLGESLLNEGLALWQTNDNKAAEQSFRHAEQVFLAIPAGERNVGTKWDLSLGQLYACWSGMLYSLSRHEEAVARVDAGLSRVEPYLQKEPNDVLARDTCLKLHGNRALALPPLNRYRESAAAWARVVELSPDPVPAAYRISLAIVLTRCGEMARAVAEARLVKDGPDVAPMDRYNLGCVFAKAAQAAQDDPKSKPEERQRLVASDITDALRWLKSAADKGYFHEASQRAHAEKDPDLVILVGRPEFREIIGNAQTKH
jgi:tetratricopeptide (TPR) repeat protein